MLESLRLAPGDRFLDVGCGCGYLAAAAALLVGPSGRAAGLDVRAACVALSRANVARLRAASAEYRAAACAATFERGNAFLAANDGAGARRRQGGGAGAGGAAGAAGGGAGGGSGAAGGGAAGGGAGGARRARFNKVCVGAACPEERAHLLLQVRTNVLPGISYVCVCCGGLIGRTARLAV